eukprot:scaffold1153_cov94-Isochrysis_galbana.AAC.5
MDGGGADPVDAGGGVGGGVGHLCLGKPHQHLVSWSSGPVELAWDGGNIENRTAKTKSRPPPLAQDVSPSDASAGAVGGTSDRAHERDLGHLLACRLRERASLPSADPRARAGAARLAHLGLNAKPDGVRGRGGRTGGQDGGAGRAGRICAEQRALAWRVRPDQLCRQRDGLH